MFKTTSKAVQQSILQKLANGYKKQLEQHPLRTKMATSAFLFSFGDFLCQKTEAAYKCRCKTQSEKSESSKIRNVSSMLTQDWDVRRTMR